jgi:hypothetical protein
MKDNHFLSQERLFFQLSSSFFAKEYARLSSHKGLSQSLRWNIREQISRSVFVYWLLSWWWKAEAQPQTNDESGLAATQPILKNAAHTIHLHIWAGSTFKQAQMTVALASPIWLHLQLLLTHWISHQFFCGVFLRSCQCFVPLLCKLRHAIPHTAKMPDKSFFNPSKLLVSSSTLFIACEGSKHIFPADKIFGDRGIS